MTDVLLGFDPEFDRPKRKPNFFSIPAGTFAVTCTTCFKSIYFITTKNGKKMPISTAVDGAKDPHGDSPGQGIPHFADCNAPDAHRRRR